MYKYILFFNIFSSGNSSPNFETFSIRRLFSADDLPNARTLTIINPDNLSLLNAVAPDEVFFPSFVITFENPIHQSGFGLEV